MILKLLGSLIVIASSSTIGLLASLRCSRRAMELKEIQGYFKIVENEIKFLSNLLPDIMRKIGDYGTVTSIFFKKCFELLSIENLDARCAWERAVNESINKTSLNREDKKILLNFGKMLGNTDVEGQIKNIGLIITQLYTQEQKAEEEKKRSQNMYIYLGVSIGLTIVILII